MNIYILALCVIQSIGEFLPISSSGHLVLLSYLFKQPPTSLEWEVALHLGTLLSIIVYFRQDVTDLVKAGFSLLKVKTFKDLTQDPKKELVISLIIATLPAIVMGFLIQDKVSLLYSPLIIGSSSILFGGLLYWADTCCPSLSKKPSLFESFIIGCFQILAFIPGASRSGTCITAARVLKLDRIQGTRFAFLLSIPTVLGAVVLTSYSAYKQKLSLDWSTIIQAITLTAILGLGVIHGLLKFLKRHNFTVLMIYRILLGIGLLGFTYFN